MQDTDTVLLTSVQYTILFGLKKILLPIGIIYQYSYILRDTVKPPIVDPPRKGHCIRLNLFTEDSSRDPKILFPYSSNTI